MSYQAINWAYELTTVAGKPITPTQKLLLVTLGNFADQEWSCFPSQATLHEMTGISERTIRDQLNLLEEAGIIRRVRRANPECRGRMTDRYYLGEPVTEDMTNRQLASTNRQSASTNRQAVAGIRNQSTNQRRTKEIDARGEVNSQLEEAFETVWKAWPKKDDRKDAVIRFRNSYRNHFRSADGLDTLVKALLDHAEAYRKYREPKYIPAMSVWLNKERWRQSPVKPEITYSKPVQKLDLTDRERELLNGQRA